MNAVSIIHMRKMRKVAASDDFADEDGTPRCLGGQVMTFLGCTSDLKLQYRCPTGGCQLKDRQGVLYCDTERIVDRRDETYAASGSCLAIAAVGRAVLEARRSRAVLLAVEAAPGAE